MSTAENQNPGQPEENGQEELTPETQADNAAPAGDDSDARIVALQSELDQAKDRMMRALADAENTRKRAQKERDDAGKYAVNSFARDLLDFADNFRRALDSIPQDLAENDPRLGNVVSGLQAMERELLSVFDKQGIQKIEPLDEQFDPNFHEVMFEAPMPGKPAGTIIQIVEPGYVLKDRLLRPARVGIAKADENGAPQGGPASPGNNIDQQA